MDTTVTPTIHIRRAAIADAAAIADVLRAAFGSYEALFKPAAFAATVLSPALMEERLRLDEGPIWVAVHDGVCVGTVSVVPHGEKLYIRSMGVAPTARRLGLAQQLLRQTQDYAIQQGFPTMYLVTMPFLHPAIRLYEQFGFQHSAAERPEFYGMRVLMLVKDLTETPA